MQRTVSSPVELSVRRALVLYGRAARLRCPHCGGRGIVDTWFRLHPRCPTCGLHTARAEEDFYLGAMMFNLVLAEGAMALLMLALAVGTWPDVPWKLLYYSTIVLMTIAPFAFFPFARTIWLASDILIRPVTSEEMRWYQEHDVGALRPYTDR